MLTPNTIQDFEPKLGVLVYHRNGDYYLQSHAITKTNEGYVWAEGKPTDIDAIGEIAATLQSKEDKSVKASTLLPRNLLYFHPSHSGATIVWFNTPKKRALSFGKKIKLKDGQYNMPGLIFFANDGSLKVFAYKGAGRPGLKLSFSKGHFTTCIQMVLFAWEQLLKADRSENFTKRWNATSAASLAADLPIHFAKK